VMLLCLQAKWTRVCQARAISEHLEPRSLLNPCRAQPQLRHHGLQVVELVCDVALFFPELLLELALLRLEGKEPLPEYLLLIVLPSLFLLLILLLPRW